MLCKLSANPGRIAWREGQRKRELKSRELKVIANVSSMLNYLSAKLGKKARRDGRGKCEL